MIRLLILHGKGSAQSFRRKWRALPNTMIVLVDGGTPELRPSVVAKITTRRILLNISFRKVNHHACVTLVYSGLVRTHPCFENQH